MIFTTHQEENNAKQKYKDRLYKNINKKTHRKKKTLGKKKLKATK